MNFATLKRIEITKNHLALIAQPEKALLDLLYLAPGSDHPQFIRELRLQNLNSLNFEYAIQLAGSAGSVKLRRALQLIVALHHSRVRHDTTIIC